MHSRAKGSFFYEINLPAQFFFQFAMHAYIGKQTDREPAVELHKYIHIAVIALLATCKGAKEPCFQDGLRLEILGNLLCQSFSVHDLIYYNTRCKDRK